MVSTMLHLHYPWESQVPVVQKAEWALGLVQMVQKISPSLGFDPWTIQSVACHCTDCAVLATDLKCIPT